MIDNLLDSNKYELFGDITNCVDIIMTHDAQTFQNTLDSITQIVNTHYSCLMINGRVIVG